MNKLVKKAEDLDPYTPIVALSVGGYADHYQAGEIGEGPCILLQDIEEALRAAEPRTDQDVFEYIASNKLSIIWIDALLDSSRKLCIHSMSGVELYVSDYEFATDVPLPCMLRDGINFIMDMEETQGLNEPFYYDFL